MREQNESGWEGLEPETVARLRAILDAPARPFARAEREATLAEWAALQAELAETMSAQGITFEAAHETVYAAVHGHTSGAGA
ncbi:MAG: hypothetical protein ACYCZN_01605 [Candidatus Dormibacteria bacterium]